MNKMWLTSDGYDRIFIILHNCQTTENFRQMVFLLHTNIFQLCCSFVHLVDKCRWNDDIGWISVESEFEDQIGRIETVQLSFERTVQLKRITDEEYWIVRCHTYNRRSMSIANGLYFVHFNKLNWNLIILHDTKTSMKLTSIRFHLTLYEAQFKDEQYNNYYWSRFHYKYVAISFYLWFGCTHNLENNMTSKQNIRRNWNRSSERAIQPNFIIHKEYWIFWCHVQTLNIIGPY